MIVTQASNLADRNPRTTCKQLNNHHTTLGKLNASTTSSATCRSCFNGNGTSFKTVLGVGKVVARTSSAAVIVVAIVTVYLLADLPRVKRGIYQLAPEEPPRPRMILLTDEILDRVGGYVLGNLLTSFIAGARHVVWALAPRHPLRRCCSAFSWRCST